VLVVNGCRFLAVGGLSVFLSLVGCWFLGVDGLSIFLPLVGCQFSWRFWAARESDFGGRFERLNGGAGGSGRFESPLYVVVQ
jgi:hypothetical protein